MDGVDSLVFSVAFPRHNPWRFLRLMLREKSCDDLDELDSPSSYADLFVICDFVWWCISGRCCSCCCCWHYHHRSTAATKTRCMFLPDLTRAVHLPKLQKITRKIYHQQNVRLKFKWHHKTIAIRSRCCKALRKREQKEDSPWRGEFGEHERLIKTKAALHSSISSPSNK